MDAGALLARGREYGLTGRIQDTQIGCFSLRFQRVGPSCRTALKDRCWAASLDSRSDQIDRRRKLSQLLEGEQLLEVLVRGDGLLDVGKGDQLVGKLVWIQRF